jgi:D-sedoheptulose 7-phosphate isomerase
VTGVTAAPALRAHLDALLARRTLANERFFAAEAGRIAALCQALGQRFGRGGRLLALGATPQGRSDARHVAVEFVHPVIVGKRALPALALGAEGGGLGGQVELLAEADDAVLQLDAGEGDAAAALALAHARGCLTVAFAAGVEASWVFDPPDDDAFVRQELVETLYHVTWELVHVFLDHAGGSSAGAGASSFLYPFLSEAAAPAAALVEDVRRSVLAKAAEVAELRRRTLEDGAGELLAAAAALRQALDAGGTVLAFGNGGSATDAMDLVADLRAAPQGWPPRRALDLTEDPAILTALANDVGAEPIFARQVIAHGRRGDVAVALSTSGGSPNIVAALSEARRRGLVTVAFVGYDGGRIAAERLADHVVVTPSEYVPRIQEAQASAYHALRELVQLVG